MKAIILISLFLLLLVVGIVGTEMRERRRASGKAPHPTDVDPNCCGQHLVCERESLLATSDEIIYYDDEELDSLAAREPQTYTEEEIAQFENIFTTLGEEDVAGWCRSLQQRNIQLPLHLREQALLIVQERRSREQKS